jgi:hypothetical protein
VVAEVQPDAQDLVRTREGRSDALIGEARHLPAVALARDLLGERLEPCLEEAPVEVVHDV